MNLRTVASVVTLLWAVTTIPVSASLRDEDYSALDVLEVPRVVCHDEARAHFVSSLSVPVRHAREGQVEVVLLTRHGVSDHGACWLESKGERYQFVALEVGRGGGLKSDWAVGVLDRRLAEDVPRLPAASIGLQGIDYLRERGIKVHVTRTALESSASGCDVRVPREGLRDPADQDSVFVSSCPMMAGKSGAPAIVRVGGGPAIVGIGLGYRFDVSGSEKEWRSPVAVVRLIDDEILQAVERLSSAAR